MSIPVTGMMIIAYLLACFFFRPQTLAQAVMFFAPFTATAVINITSVPIGLSPSYLAMALTMLAGVVYGTAFTTYRVTKDHLLQVLALLVFLFVALASLLVPALFSDARDFAGYQPASSLVTQTIYIVFGIVTTVVLSFEFSRPGQLERTIRTARLSCSFVCFWAIVQGVCFYAHIPYPAVLFNNSVSKSADMFAQDFGTIVRLASVAVEPSVMVFSLLHFLAFGLTVVLLDPKLRVRSWLFPIGITTLLILGSTSSTGYFGLALVTLLLGIRRPMQVLVASLPPIILGAITLAALPEFRRILWEVTFNKTDSYSYMVRMDDVRQAFELFFRNPIFGAGWGAVTPSDLFGTLLGNSGVVGLSTYIGAVAVILISLQAVSRSALQGGDIRLRAYAIGAQNSIIVSIGCSLSSGMKYYFLDDWCYWAIAIALSSRHVLRPAAVALKRAVSSAGPAVPSVAHNAG